MNQSGAGLANGTYSAFAMTDASGFFGGEFLGGSDILSQMHQSGELREEIERAFSAAEAAAE